jgi:hypothetical protein
MADISVVISPAVAEQLRLAGERDSRLGAGEATRTAQEAVAAWARAADGDDTDLASLGGPDAASWLTQPVNSKAKRLAPGAQVTGIEITGVDPGTGQLSVRFEFTGRWVSAGPGQAGRQEPETSFTGSLDLRLDESGPQPWRLAAGYIQRLSSWIGYEFSSRRETPAEYQERTGAAGAPGPTAGPGRMFRVCASIAEHDERISGSVSVLVARLTVPSRAEAEQLIWPAVDAATADALGPGDWRPSLNSLDVIELLGGPLP